MKDRNNNTLTHCRIDSAGPVMQATADVVWSENFDSDTVGALFLRCNFTI